MFALGAALSAYAQTPPAQGAVAADGVPALKITTPAGHHGILIGTVHVGLQGLRDPAPAIFDGAKRHVVERDPVDERNAGAAPAAPARKPWWPAFTDYKKTGRLGRAPWATALTQDELNEMKRRLVCVGLPAEKLDQAVDALLALESPLSASELAILPCAPAGNVSRDQLLAGYAAARGLPTFGLESASEVEARRLAVPDRIHLQHLRVGLSDRQPRAMTAIAQALNAGNFDQVMREMHGLAASEEDAALYERLMLADRNEAWVPRLVKYLEDGDAVISVGAGHLSGPNGLESLLRQAGMRVEPIVLPAASHEP